MINIKKIVLLVSLYFQGCMEPNSNNLWSVSIDSVFETQGFARSVTIEGSKAFVAAGQSGSQLSLIHISEPTRR